MNPLLLDIPERLQTPRLLLRVPRAGDGAMVCASVRESLPELKPWMPWAKDDYGEADGEAWCRRNAGEFITRARLNFLILLPNGEHLGNCGMHDADWELPGFEIGYWLHTKHAGNGYATEAVSALTRLMLDQLKAVRVEIRVDERNARSCRVAERCGFQLDGTLRHDFRHPDGRLRDTRVYSRVVGA
jgi:ribosomal-protein-serine acetyltransferase